MALHAARAGAEMLVKDGLRMRPGQVHVKAAGDYVTDTDRRSEAAIVEVLRMESPGIPVAAEERGGPLAETVWAVDPLDGTTNFIRGLPAVAVSVGLIYRGRPELGVVLAPFLELEFTVAAGHGAHLNGARLGQLGPGVVDHAVVATGFPFRRKSRLSRYLPVMEGALQRFEDLRRVGAAALDLAWTAAGTFDGFFELGLNAWDVAAGAALLREVGGVVTDWSGGDAWLTTGDILAAPSAVHAALLQLAAEPAQG